MAFLPIIAAIASAASGVVGAIGAAQKGEAEAKAAEFNAQNQRTQANMEIQKANEEERRARITGKKQLGKMVAATSASGINLEGSALDVLDESASNVELDALNIRHQGQMRAWSLRQGAELDTMRASSSRQAGTLGAASSLLGTAGTLAGRYGKKSSEWD